MEQRDYGNTGVRVSALSFGAMRLPVLPEGEGVDFDRAVEVLHRAFALGVNLVDSCWGYHDGQSEVAVGRALAAWQGPRVYVQTKAAYYRERAVGEDDRSDLEEQLRRLGRPIDFYLMHSLNWKKFEEHGAHWLQVAEAARSRGEVVHVGFSVHDKPENVIRLIDTGAFEVMVIQYNLLDHRNAEAMAHARARGLGVAVMGPVGGGRLAAPSKVLAAHVPPDVVPGAEAARNAELALRFVLANPDVSTAMSGMTTLDVVERNAGAAERAGLPAEVCRALLAAVEARKPLHDTGCTGCAYCKPCPAKIEIPSILSWVGLCRVWGLEDSARAKYAQLGKVAWMGATVSACQDCGQCEERCPQKLPVRKLLAEAHELLAPDGKKANKAR